MRSVIMQTGMQFGLLALGVSVVILVVVSGGAVKRSEMLMVRRVPSVLSLS